MARSEGQKLKLLLIKDLLEAESDENHPLPLERILRHLRLRGIRAERKSIYSDLACLRAYGMDILTRRGRGGGYFLASRAFSLPELKLLVDAVQSSRFLTERKSLELISKLERLTSIHEAGRLRRQVVVSGRVKTMNESIYYNVDAIHEAIASNSRITFRYFEWGVDRKKHYRDRTYEASPYALIWSNENYYLVADSARHGLTHYRVDKMSHITATGEPRAVTEASRRLDPAAYSRSVFSMYGGAVQRVRMRFHQSLAGVVVDRFGRDAILAPDGPDFFTCTFEIAVSPVFLGWMASFGDKAEILFPASVREQLRQLLSASLAQYAAK